MLLLHGFTGTPANMHSIWKCLEADEQECRLNTAVENENGYTIYAPLLSGHGTNLRNMRKSCAREWIDDALKAYDRLTAAGCEKIYVAGLSMGGLLAAIVASERRVDGVIMICAPAKMKLYLHICRFISLAVPYIITGEPHWHAMSESREDFVENIAVYVTNTEDYWNNMLQNAGESGRALIKQKFEIVYSYMEQTWGINLDELRDIVLRRQDDIANGNVDLSIIE